LQKIPTGSTDVNIPLSPGAYPDSCSLVRTQSAPRSLQGHSVLGCRTLLEIRYGFWLSHALLSYPGNPSFSLLSFVTGSSQYVHRSFLSPPHDLRHPEESPDKKAALKALDDIPRQAAHPCRSLLLQERRGGLYESQTASCCH